MQKKYGGSSETCYNDEDGEAYSNGDYNEDDHYEDCAYAEYWDGYFDCKYHWMENYWSEAFNSDGNEENLYWTSTVSGMGYFYYGKRYYAKSYFVSFIAPHEVDCYYGVRSSCPYCFVDYRKVRLSAIF